MIFNFFLDNSEVTVYSGINILLYQVQVPPVITSLLEKKKSDKVKHIRII